MYYCSETVFILTRLEVIFMDLIKKYSSDKNIKASTMEGYTSAIRKYEQFHAKNIEELITEAKVEEDLPLNKRKIKERLINFRKYLIKSNLSSRSAKTYFSKIKAFYRFHDIEIPEIPNIKYNRDYQMNYKDLPSKEHVKKAVEISEVGLQAMILFMASSGTAKAETLSLTVGDFIKATDSYHDNGSIADILDTLENKCVIPTFYLKRIKTNKYYYTFCTPEATSYIVKYLKSRPKLKKSFKLFNYSSSAVTAKFREINDSNNWGFRGRYRFFRPHALRKFHASNISLSPDIVDELQGRGKSEVHDAYIKTRPEAFKKSYKNKMANVCILKSKETQKDDEFNIYINIFVGNKTINIL